MRPPERERWHIVSITAHRQISLDDVRKVHIVMRKIVSLPHIDAIYFGGARGGDSEALKAALHFRVNKRPHLTVVVPDKLVKQPFETHAISKQADEIVELGHRITPDDGFAAYDKRDQYLVDVATSLVAFFGGNYATGTGKTVRMAERDGIVVTKIGMRG
jgi:hypothetical protein